jgi:rare lipoprotein A
MASWYGDDFHGKMTANGEIFDKRRLSAAHKTLPLPTIVEVENLENGRRAVVRVNDRGPFRGKRVIDLSHAAADQLGFTQQGVARVRVRYLGDADVYGAAALPGEAAPVIAASAIEPDRLASLIASATGAEAAVPSTEEIWVELAAVEDLATLEKMNLDLPDVGPVTVQSGDSGGRRMQFLRVGPFIDEAIAFASLSRVRAAGFGGARIVRRTE